MENFDLIVIGSGAGLAVATVAAHTFHKRVAVIENGPLGGTCLNRGCIPSKIIIHAARVARQVARAKEFGINASIDSIDFKQITEEASIYVDGDSQAIERGLKQGENPRLIQGIATFTEPKTLEVNGQKISAEQIVIAAGARPMIPTIPGLDTVPFLTSTEALRLTTQPKSLVIIGGGYIAAELGEFYGALGTKVTIIQRSSRLIPREDQSVGETFTTAFKRKFTVITDATTTKVEQSKTGVTVTLTVNGKSQTVESEQLLIATGISPNTDSLKVDQAGLQTNDSGYVVVNDFLETNVSEVFAMGDITGLAPFRHAANYHADVIIQNLFTTEKVKVDHSIMPRAIFSDPEVAAVGLTEAQARKKFGEVEVRLFHYRQTAMGHSIKEEQGFVKTILKDDRIVGCHILGPEASILIEEVCVAMKAGGDVNLIKNTIHIHPSLSEVIQWGL